MKHLSTVAALIAAFAIIFATAADAQTEKSKAGKAVQDRSRDVVDRVEMGREELPRPDKKSRERIEDAMEDEDAGIDDQDSVDVDMRNDDVVREKSGKAKDQSAKMKDKSAKGLDNAAGRGNEKSQEMRARRDERKMIKEEYRANGKGAEDAVNDAVDAGVDKTSEDGEKKEKKPWWKFWN